MDISPLQKTVAASDIPPERLAGNTSLTDQQKITEASRQFEAILLRQILAATQKTVIPSKFADNSTAADIYRDMITTQLADSISKSGSFGLAQTFERQLTRPPVGPKPGLTTSPTLHPQAPIARPGHDPKTHSATALRLPTHPSPSGHDF